MQSLQFQWPPFPRIANFLDCTTDRARPTWQLQKTLHVINTSTHLSEERPPDLLHLCIQAPALREMTSLQTSLNWEGAQGTFWTVERLYFLKVKVTQSCPTLCDPMDYTVHGIPQARILQWVAFPFSRGSSQSRNQIQVSCIAGGFFTNWATREALLPELSGKDINT